MGRPWPEECRLHGSFVFFFLVGAPFSYLPRARRPAGRQAGRGQFVVVCCDVLSG